ncbi:MAG TPA: DUF5715 family protein [Vicinamibacteria bacterium]|jgi:hypothetical protein
MTPSSKRAWLALGVLGVALGLSAAVWRLSRRQPAPTAGAGERTEMQPPPGIPPKLANPWKEAAAKVEENRGAPTGRQVRVPIPPELRHYGDRRRFLAVQVAKAEEENYALPPDWAALIKMIRSGELVEVPPVGDDYVLYGVGAHASGEPFTHYDPKRKVDLPLYGGWDDYIDADAEAAAEAEQAKARIAELQADLKKTPPRDRKKRRALATQVRTLKTALAGVQPRRALAASYYEDYDRRRALVDEYRTIDQFARNLGGRSYDIRRPEDRRQLQARLLSYIRPEARDVMVEIAHAYKEKFSRPLPVTSLVRTERYQRELGETNPNATRISVPPHATGLAFDIFYGRMNADEQGFLMDTIARMEDEGRLEALRENRDHYHVFAFPDGRRPPEALVAQTMREMGPATQAKAAKAVSARRGPARLAARPAARPGARPAAARAFRAAPRSAGRRPSN